MTYDQHNTIAEFLDGTAAKQPAPGGGSVAALAGALSASIGEMVINYSVGKKGLEAHQDELKKSLAELHRARQIMLELVTEDQSAYQALNAAKKLPQGSPDRESQFAPALLAAIRAPEAIAATAASILDLCHRLVPIVNYYLLSDLAVCADLAMTTVRCGIYNVRVNLADVSDPADRQKIEATLASMLARGLSAIQRVSPAIWERNRIGK
ncbi:MAG TPA: cyclodeaminase/cyclohydrolase family protein [Tepidisphaeraceae bacterium]